MNIYISDDLKKKWINYEFLGKPFKLGDGKMYMRAYSRCFETTHFYCLDDDFFWHDKNSIPLKIDKSVEPESTN
jgi:hypothetical protein